MAMKVGGEYRLAHVRGRHWRRLAETFGLDAAGVVSRVADLAQAAPACMEMAAGAAPVQRLGLDLPERLTGAVQSWAGDCLDRLDG